MENASQGSTATDATIREKSQTAIFQAEGITRVGTLRHLLGPVAIVAILCLITVMILLLWKMPNYPTYALPHGPLPSKDLFDLQIKDYKAGLAKLDATLSLQALLIVTTILIVIRRSDTLNFFGNSIPLSWLHVFIPVLLIYLWLASGYIVHELILGRMRGVEIALAQPQLGPAYQTLFRDAGWIDGWFVSFVDSAPNAHQNFSGIDRKYSTTTQILLVAVLGTFIAAAHASALAIASIGSRRYLSTSQRQRLLAYYLSPLVPLTFILISHFLFAYGGDNRNWFQLYVAIVMLPLTAFLLWLSAKFDIASYPESLQCLRRAHQVTLSGPIDRLPLRHSSGSRGSGHGRTIALIGDSLSTGFHVSSFLAMRVRMRRAWMTNWFLTLPANVQVGESVLARLSALGTITGVQYASVSARVNDTERRSAFDCLTGTYHFSHQVDEVLAGRFPDILLLWIGNNAVDWRSEGDTASPGLLLEMSTVFARRYEIELRRLLNGALGRDGHAVLVVFGLTNFESFFRGRAEAESAKGKDSSVFPHLESGYRHFVSMRPEYRDGMIKLSALLNGKLEAICRRLGEKLIGTNVRLVYSNAMSVARMDDTAFLSPVDAWHASIYGHGRLADSAYPIVYEQAQFLGWDGTETL
jgi:hypothetical protein